MLISLADSSRELAWGALDDVLMGGMSESTFQIDLSGGENGRPTFSHTCATNAYYLLTMTSFLSERCKQCVLFRICFYYEQWGVY